MKIFCIGLAIAIIDVVAHGVAGKLCWNWFVPEVWTAAPRLTFPTAIGLMFVSTLFATTGRAEDFVHSSRDERTHQALMTGLLNGCVRPLAILLYAWGIHALLF